MWAGNCQEPWDIEVSMTEGGQTCLVQVPSGTESQDCGSGLSMAYSQTSGSSVAFSG
jgi:hypothetical protein